METQSSNLYIDVPLTSNELYQYRVLKKYQAVCEEQKLRNGWICPCGLFHDYSEEKCDWCNMELK